jgi:thiamine biosynthesis protein ThiS
VAERVVAMTILLNGKPRLMNETTTVAGLLRELHLPPVRVAVEVNEELVSRSQFEETSLREGDRVEVVTFVGGG